MIGTCFTPSGVFSGGRKADQLVVHSGLISLDFDLGDNPHLKNGLDEDVGKLITDPFVAAVFRSLSGAGIAVISRIDPARHEDAYRGLCAYFRAEYGLEQDPGNTGEVSARLTGTGGCVSEERRSYGSFLSRYALPCTVMS